MAQKVIFTLAADLVGEATSGILLGEFNNWNYAEGIDLKKQKDGSMSATALLEAGKTYQYRYLLDDGRWVNDQRADRYVHVSELQIENCVVKVEAPKKAEKAALKVEKVVEKEVVLKVPKKGAEKKELVTEAPKKSLAQKESQPPKKADAKKVVASKEIEQKVLSKKLPTSPSKVVTLNTTASKTKVAKSKK